MGIISDITSGKISVNTNINQNDSEESIFAKAYIENQETANHSTFSNGESFSIDKNNAQLNDKNIETTHSREQEFIQIDENISEAQVEGIASCINSLPPSMCDYLIKNGWTIKVNDMSLREFTDAMGFSNRTNPIAGITHLSTKTIELPNLSELVNSQSRLYSKTLDILGHELGHVFDKEFGMLSNSQDWRNAWENEKDKFSCLDARGIHSQEDIEKINSFFRTYPDETFAEAFSKYFSDGPMFTIFGENKDTPEICTYIINTIECIKDYLDEDTTTSFEEFFTSLNPNTDMEEHEYNHTLRPDGTPSYRDF